VPFVPSISKESWEEDIVLPEETVLEEVLPETVLNCSATFPSPGSVLVLVVSHPASTLIRNASIKNGESILLNFITADDF
jgi:hypothetical protein